MERRKHERLPIRSGRSVPRVPADVPYRVINISSIGCALECGECLDVEGGRVVIDLPLPARVNSLTLAAKVVWASYEGRYESPRFQYGLCFDDMDNVSRAILDAYLDYLRRDIHIVKLEESWAKLQEVQERIELLVACEERKNTPYLH